MTYRYYCPCRPPAPGAIPPGVTRIVYADDDAVMVDEEGYPHKAWAMVEYDRRLTDKELEDYELDEI